VDLFGNRLYRAKDEDFGPWVGGATPAQIGLLKKLGVNGGTAARFTKKQASAVIAKLLRQKDGER
jgi:hypothetical protein